MHHLDPFYPLQHSIRCYQELRRDAVKALYSQCTKSSPSTGRFSLFSSRKKYRRDELVLGLNPFAGYAFGIN